MKHLFLILVLVGCTTLMDDYKSKYFRNEFTDKRSTKEVFDILVAKMRKCYRDELIDKFIRTGIEASYSETSKLASIAYLYDNDLRIVRVHHVDLIPAAENQTLVKIYSEGGGFTTVKDFKRNVPAWLAGEQVWCRGRGKI